jgi:hypothetical protein
MIEIYETKFTDYILWKRKDNNLIHREDGPAIIFDDGGLCWIQNDKDHRVGGPARDLKTGKSWWRNGIRHRLNAYARHTYEEKRKEWYIFGVLIKAESDI